VDWKRTTIIYYSGVKRTERPRFFTFDSRIVEIKEVKSTKLIEEFPSGKRWYIFEVEGLDGNSYILKDEYSGSESQVARKEGFDCN
jgi:hypothetical protein